MKRLTSVLCASLLTLAMCSVTFAGNISGRAGNISGKGGNISGIYGNISGFLLDILIP
jgi:hypothetical protein